ncbi:AraC family transcriptional regulator [Thiorhodococcus mannitoliphagus]|uniref:AraC family transcriptional regulator n=1 Tax=Thiorhodococcus mannitoliphagus TaxID=329406 RepID=A0A6P1DU42_9GAMM|nr:AraC family transcriptional regulator [Thiorhodococcus mannitoliphagus]NEX20980.1 AraC family transcriptional regulator [Thiorhodococcus mannitoliphagus]
MKGSDSEDRAPEFELSPPHSGTIHYLEHGYPSPLVRWHHHNAYELHYIVASSGRVFVGDYVGEFEPGCLILTGPRLPHNWISDIACADRIAVRDMLVQFDHSTIEGAAALLPEFCEVLPLMESARLGIEFAGMQQQASHYMSKIRDSSGLTRLSYFCQFLHELARHSEQRTLSAGYVETIANDLAVEKINIVVNFMAQHFQEKISLSQAANLLNMNASYFSRFFSKTTGTTFCGFLAQIRIGKACELLSTTDQHITSICYDVGYTNIANFNRRFLEHKKMTPREYRRQTRERLSRDCNEATSGSAAGMALP